MDIHLSSGKGYVQHHTNTSGHNLWGLCIWGHTLMGSAPSDLDLWKIKINGLGIGSCCLQPFSSPFSLIIH